MALTHTHPICRLAYTAQKGEERWFCVPGDKSHVNNYNNSCELLFDKYVKLYCSVCFKTRAVKSLYSEQCF